MKNTLCKSYFSAKIDLKMKISALFLLVALFQLNANNSYSQKFVSMKMENASIASVFEKIEESTDYNILYKNSTLDLNKRISVDVEKVKIDVLMDIILAESNISYEIRRKLIVLVEKENEPEKISTQSEKASKPNFINITGTVTDENNSPLPGVSIVIKGTIKGVSSDFDGNYAIDASQGDILVYSYIGYQTKEITVGNNPVVNVTMVPSVSNLDEVIVTAIGTKQLKDESGSTSSTIQSENIAKSGEAGVINALAGKASGVRIGKSNGDPGAGSSIQIRGANTIQGASQPLIILDGIPVSNDNIGGVTLSQQSRLDDINPKDIASVQILKGASAAALWGSRAANGVIVITTKSGQLGQKPTIQYTFSQSYDYINVRTPLQNSFGQGRNGVFSTSFAESWGDKITDRSGEPDDLDTSGASFLSSTTGNRYYPVISKNSRETFTDSNYDKVFRIGTFSQHNVSVNGGGQRASYFFSYENLDQKGIIKNYDYKRQNVRLNTKFQMTDWLSWNNRVSFTNTRSNRIEQAGETTNGILLGLLRTAPDFDITDYIGTYTASNGDIITNRQRSYRRQLGESENPIYNNPLWTLNEQKAPNDVNRFIINPELTIDPVNWLKVILRGGLDYYTDARSQFYPIGSASGLRSSGYWSQTDINSKEFNLDGIIVATHDFSNDLGVSATFGVNFNDRKRVINTNTISPFAVDSRLPTPDLNPDQAASSWNRNLQHIRSNRGYGILGINLYGQLFFNFSGALEASSTIKGSFFYPSVDLAWQFSDLVGSSDFLSFGKLRAAWGKVGIQPAPYKFETLATTGFSNFGGSFMVDSEKGNPNLKPEIKTEWEVGTDLRFFKDRVGLGFTYYRNETKDILFAVKANPSSGFNFNYKNAAVIENKGLEVDLTGKLIETDDLKLSINTNYNNNENMVVDIAGAETVDIGGTSKAVKGYPMSSFFLPGTLRNEDNSLALDANGFPQLDTESRVLGDPNPDWRGGIGMQLNFKGLDFSFLFEHSQGGDFINRTRVVLYGFGVHKDVAQEVTLTEDLVNVNGDVILAGTTVRGNIADFGGGDVLLDESWYRGIGGGLGFNKTNDLFIEDATWTKLRNVTLGYTFSGLKLSKKLALDSFRISVTGRDLILWTGIKDVDPETNNYGVSNAFGMNYFNNPGTRSILFNLQANF
ncbi:MULTISPECIES: SusC/RagA family TonB-linked outer membrane protein [Flavobacteriaceae]|jgi:TonB-linked SusC/RagA family outer membrane protein|uniref:SusC/RagA family TonB-linked outer membrane protein n=4 Tax=Flagellimonas TaxID=444459 RepID=A0A3A1NKE2_9FLAO|nr:MULTISPECIES: SusC/RagA family TonB-linked outer membrane protein [Allomuricauda]MBO0356093.1 SusC/RagA family TonB-linked outer membrane protein [Allomuricauda aurea]RIV44795.1 SusC/RagA family TonB-linked outer membrane protein [Allomuricauda maritima]TXJ95102.1 SusC/RagA family TonB-linked outer membrane protein [Allomuricauda maritima]UBZ14380.1 SusC/RagA family TonB-linked outer membrane protein [Allomuricauda aquimarina]